ncbi:hypothetical protein [Caenispirillum bisanense]|uniref:Regulator of G protein signaling domain-containing protein n=1 Tax=Caenispirillum bisanense TaxID=414052 RepID=A0A286GI50_9PROT|nr:hypothetical protein [Caenispirillum bisanense]SOD94896.1 Regulator of G protein signaling domain-containing protein [Caenispirillum bisanense]
MSVPDILTKYPAVLTNKDWQKKKGPFAKMAGKTGVGEALQACEKAWGAVDWSVFDAQQVRKKGPGAVVNGFKTAQAEYKKSVEGLRKALMAAIDAADKSAAAFKKNKLIPSSATKAAADISKMAQFMLVGTKSIDMKDFEALADRCNRLIQIKDIDSLKRDKELDKEFVAYAKKEDSYENYLFLEKSKGAKITAANAQAVYDAFLSTSAKNQINVPGKLVKEYEKNMQDGNWDAMEGLMLKLRSEAATTLSDTLLRFKLLV